MNEIVEDLSSAALAPALEANMAAFYAGWGRAPQADLYEGPDLVRMITGIPYPMFNGIFYARLEPGLVEAAVAAALAYLATRQVPAFWWVGPATRPRDLGTYLERQGCAHVRDVPGMAVDLQALNEDPPAPADLTVERVADGQALRTWARVAWDGTGFPEPGRDAFIDLVASLGAADVSRHRYLGYRSGVPVAASALVLHAGVAGIFAVATLPEARRQGIGTAMTRVPLRDARERGYRVGTLQASEMGVSVYRRLGFREVCAIGLYRWAG